MLPERYRELLTAYVDGELSARRRRQVARLLQHSAEARRLLQHLQGDSRELINLPCPRLDRDMSAPVLQKIAARRLTPARPVIRRFPAARNYPTWVSAAAAAAVLVAVGTASYWYFAASLDRPASPSVAVTRNQSEHSPGSAETKDPTDSANSVAQAPRHDADPKPDRDPAPPRRPADEVAHQKPTDATTPPAMEKEDPALTSEGMELFTEIKSVAANLDVPVTFKLHDLEQDAVHKKLLAELQKDAALRLELPVRDGTEAFKRLQTVLKAHHVEVAIDASAGRRLERPALHTNCVLYSEDLTADELGQVLRQLAVEDKKDKTPAANPFDRLVVRRLTERDHKELSDLMGVDPVQAPAKDAGPLGLDPHKPVSDGTAAQLAQAPARPEPGKPAAKPPAEHPVLVMPYNPVRPRRDSAEVKRFLEERKPMRAGTLQVLLVLRGPTG